MQTLDHLLQQGFITPLQYLERIPDGYIPGRKALINELKAQQEAASAPAPQEMPQSDTPNLPPTMSGGAAATGMEIPTGGGYSQLQRAINSGEA